MQFLYGLEKFLYDDSFAQSARLDLSHSDLTSTSK